MKALKAHVRGGRLVLDEPTDLPDGEVVYLAPAEAATPDVDFDADERARLDAALDEGIAAGKADDHEDAEQFVRELLSRP